MANRTLDYHAGEIVWECHEMRRCECGEADRRSLDTPKKSFVDALAQLSSQPTSSVVVTTEGENANKISRKDPQNVWLDIVEGYSKLSLTFATDRLPALSGLAQAMASSGPGEESYLAGFWRRDLPIALLWYPSVDGQPIRHGSLTYKSNAGVTKRNSDIPSWSWVSVSTPVSFPHFGDHHAAARVTARIDEICADPVTSDPYGKCGPGRVVITGPLLAAKLKYNNTKWDKFWVRTTSGLWFAVSPDLDHSVRGTGYWLNSGTEVRLLVIARSWAGEDKSHGLILLATGEREGEGERENGGGREVYRRIGAFERTADARDFPWMYPDVGSRSIFRAEDVRTVVII